jgi:DNA-binding response OmpR family regulator
MEAPKKFEEYSMTNCKVLLIEDIESEAKLVMKHLKCISGWRFSVDHHDRLGSGIQQISGNRYDVVLLDLSRPDCAGIEVCQRMFAAARTPQLSY